MNRYSYPATLTPSEEGGYVVTFRDLPEAVTQGESLEESLAQASDCLAEAIAARIDDNREVPKASEIGPADGRVGRERYHSLPPSEPDVRLSPHPAQAMHGIQALLLVMCLLVTELM